ncbi:hypothetical protein D3C84_1234190 [compost metagenome]
MLDICGDHQTGRIRLEPAKLIQLAASQAEQLIDYRVMAQQLFVGDGGFPQ